MKKSWIKKVISILCCFFLTFSSGCFLELFGSAGNSSVDEGEKVCEHTWKDATCTSAKYCSKCREQEGSALGHDWINATCFEPSKCSRCDKTSGIHINHEGGEATCSQRAICENCNQEYGFKLNHSLNNGVCLDCGYENVATDSSYFEFTLLKNGSYSIKVKDKENLPTKVVIPATYESAPVTEIEKRGFASCVNLEEIEIPSSITKIAEEAFLNCVSLTEIALPEGLSEIKKNTFLYCVSLKRIKIPTSLTYIANDAFFACYNLIETHLTDISSWCNVSMESEEATPTFKSRYLYFENQMVREMTIPEGVTKINSYVFAYSTIEKLKISKTVSEIDSGAFFNCGRLKEIICEENSSLSTINSRAFYYCSNLETVDLTNASLLTKLGSSAFSYCDKVKSVYGNSLKNWLQIEFESGDANPLQSDAELYLEGKLVEDLYIPARSYKINKYAFYNCGSLKRLYLNRSTQEIMPYAFAGCDLLEEIYFVKYGDLVAIDGHAFSGCDILLEVTVPADVSFVGSHAFSDCANLRSVVFESGSKVTSLWDFVSNCPQLETVKLPDNLQYLSENFYASTKLRQNENGVIYVDGWAVDVVGKVETLRFRDGTKGIGVGLPYYIIQEVKKIYLPKSVKFISKGAFSYCNSAKFYCEAQSKPATWITDWCPSGCLVVWGYTDE